MRSPRNAIVTGLIIVCGLIQASAGQEESQKADDQDKIDSETVTRVTLGSSSGTPGAVVVVPIYFTPAQDLEVGRLKLEVNYVSANLKFTRLDPGVAAELGAVNLHTEVKEGKNENSVETQTLIITASFLSPEPPKKGIPAGLLAFISLRVDEDGRPASIGFRTSAEATELGTNKPVTNLRVSEAKVDVFEAGSQPLVTCFFFSH